METVQKNGMMSIDCLQETTNHCRNFCWMLFVALRAGVNLFCHTIIPTGWSILHLLAKKSCRVTNLRPSIFSNWAHTYLHQLGEVLYVLSWGSMMIRKLGVMVSNLQVRSMSWCTHHDGASWGWFWDWALWLDLWQWGPEQPQVPAYCGC